MIAVDTNLLVYAHREDSSFHEKALTCITNLAEGRSLWGYHVPASMNSFL